MRSNNVTLTQNIFCQTIAERFLAQLEANRIVRWHEDLEKEAISSWINQQWTIEKFFSFIFFFLVQPGNGNGYVTCLIQKNEKETSRVSQMRLVDMTHCWNEIQHLVVSTRCALAWATSEFFSSILFFFFSQAKLFLDGGKSRTEPNWTRPKRNSSFLLTMEKGFSRTHYATNSSH